MFCSLAVAQLAACSSDDSATTCSAGGTQDCTCTGGGEGTKTCTAEGAWTECTCLAADAGVPDQGTPDPDQGLQIPDFSVDGSLPPPPDAGPPADSAPQPDSAQADIAVFTDGGPQDSATPDLPTSSVGLHGDCTAPLTCVTGLACMSYDQVQPPICFQDCTSDPSVCAANTDGRTTCRGASPTTDVCMEVVATGGACDIALSKVCGPADLCTNGTCTPAPVVARFAPCGGSLGVCDTGQTCVQVNAALSHGACLDDCDPTTTACMTGAAAGTCIALSTPGAGVCLPEGSGAQDGLCGQEEGQPFDPAKECATGTACITFAEDAVKGLCLPEVTDCSAPSACAAGRVCLPLSSGAGVCGEDCQADATVCTANAKNCSEIGTGDSICTPAGSVAFGGLCSSANLCAPDLTCLRVSAASAEGYCTQTCISDPDCPTTPAGAACAEVAPPTSLCVFPCGQPGQTCPTGLTCDTVGTSSLCVAQ